jgi:hypothetical protein
MKINLQIALVNLQILDGQEQIGMELLSPHSAVEVDKNVSFSRFLHARRQ